MSGLTRPGDNEQAFPSTTWTWKRVKVDLPPEANGDSPVGTAEKLVRQSRERLARQSLRRPTEAVLKYRGGDEAWVEVRARGRVWRFPGYSAIYDVIRELAGERLE